MDAGEWDWTNLQIQSDGMPLLLCSREDFAVRKEFLLSFVKDARPFNQYLNTIIRGVSSQLVEPTKMKEMFK